MFISNILNTEQVKWNDKVVQWDPKGFPNTLKIGPIKCKQKHNEQLNYVVKIKFK
jgi:hypothetical protein